MGIIFNKAIDLLSRSEHSRAMLRDKLYKRFPDVNNDLDEVLDLLEEKGYLSDLRYAEMFLRTQISKFRGPTRILFEAEKKGVKFLVKSLLENEGIDWNRNAVLLIESREHSKYSDKGKLFQYLSGQGYDFQTCAYVYSYLYEGA